MASHTARTHIISKQQASPIALPNSTAIGPKAMRYRNGFTRIVTSLRPPKRLARPQHDQSLGSRKAPPSGERGLKLGSMPFGRSSVAKQFRPRGLVPERKAPPKRGQVYCGRKGLWTSAAKQFGGWGLVPWRRALATRVTRCCRGATEFGALLRCAALSGRRLDKFSSSRRRSGRQLLNILDAIATAGDGA
jgi:hypothetical protein